MKQGERREMEEQQRIHLMLSGGTGIDHYKHRVDHTGILLASLVIATICILLGVLYG